MENLKQTTLAGIVKQYHQTAPVFEKYHLDFCCNGKRTLETACREKELSLESIEAELKQAIGEPSSANQDFDAYDPGQLISHIILKHHSYVKQASLPIKEHLLRVASKHGDRFPEMKKVYALFLEIEQDLQLHLQKEEVILFPRIREIYDAGQTKNGNPFDASYLSGPIAVMEADHTNAGGGMEEIRQLTNNYTPPAGACTTFCLVMDELRAFEEDLHQHVHLENNILFPKAEQLLQSLN